MRKRTEAAKTKQNKNRIKQEEKTNNNTIESKDTKNNASGNSFEIPFYGFSSNQH